MSRRRYPYSPFTDGWFADDWPTAPRRYPPRAVPVHVEGRTPRPEIPEVEPRPAPAEVRPAPVPAEPPAPTAASDGDPDKQRLRDALRELERSRERVERNAARVADETKRDLIEQLLPLLDNLDRSIAAAAVAADASPLRDGVELVRAQFEKVLLGYGVEKLDAVGRPFDPNEHDAVAVVAVDDHRSDGVVLDEWQPGYRMGDRVLRAAKVRVGKLAA